MKIAARAGHCACVLFPMSNRDDLLLRLKRWLMGRLPKESHAEWRRRFQEPLGWFFRKNLPRLATIYGTDKWGYHWYAAHYARHFGPFRTRRITILEIGIGGYNEPKNGGGSLRMWRRYFPHAKIVGLDYFDKSPHAEERIRIYRGDQSDEAFLQRMVAEIGRPDIIIDDGSHQNAHVRKSFQVLFPLLADGGIYAVEDTQTSYWPEYGGSSDDLQNAPTSMGLLKSLIDGLNYEEFIKPGYAPTYEDENITALHFYHNLVFIQKGRNKEGSNLIRNNEAPAQATFPMQPIADEGL